MQAARDASGGTFVWNSKYAPRQRIDWFYISSLPYDFPPADEDADANITVVRTAAQLQAAVVAGAQDIEIQEHLDLSDLNLPMDDSGWGLSVLGTVKPSTRSVRVRIPSSGLNQHQAVTLRCD